MHSKHIKKFLKMIYNYITIVNLNLDIKKDIILMLVPVLNFNNLFTQNHKSRYSINNNKHHNCKK